MTNSNLFKLSLLLITTLSFNAQANFFSHAKNALLGESTTTDYNYIGAKGGVATPSSTEGNSDLQSVAGNITYSGGIFVGRKFMDRYGFEIEFSQRGHSDIDSSNLANDVNTTNNWGVSAKTVMLNLTADLLTHETIRPYIKLGAGFSRNKADNYIHNSNNTTTTWNGKTGTEFAWNAGIGLSLATYKSIDTFFEYAFINRGKFETYNGATLSTGGSTFADSDSNAKFGYLREQIVSVGFKVKF